MIDTSGFSWADACIAWVHAPLTDNERFELFDAHCGDTEFAVVTAFYADRHTEQTLSQLKEKLNHDANDDYNSAAVRIMRERLLLPVTGEFTTDSPLLRQFYAVCVNPNDNDFIKTGNKMHWRSAFYTLVHPECSVETMEAMKDFDQWVWPEVVINPSTPVHLIKYMLNRPTGEVSVSSYAFDLILRYHPSLTDEDRLELMLTGYEEKNESV